MRGNRQEQLIGDGTNNLFQRRAKLRRRVQRHLTERKARRMMKLAKMLFLAVADLGVCQLFGG
jgi:hypothetical protein